MKKSLEMKISKSAIVRWILPQGGLKIAYLGLAITVLTMILETVYKSPNDFRAFIFTLPGGKVILWIRIAAMSLFTGGLTANAIRKLKFSSITCINNNQKLLSVICSLVLILAAIVFSLFFEKIYWYFNFIFAYLLYVFIVSMVPLTCKKVFGHCHKCENAVTRWKTHYLETILALILSFGFFCFQVTKDRKQIFGESKIQNYTSACAGRKCESKIIWQLPSIENGRKIYNELLKNNYNKITNLENEIDELVFNGASPMEVYIKCRETGFYKSKITNQKSKIPYWNLAMYLRSRTATVPRKNLEKELFDKWKEQIMPGCPAYFWYDWVTLRNYDDNKIAGFIEKARLKCKANKLSDYELQRMIDLIRSFGVQ